MFSYDGKTAVIDPAFRDLIAQFAGDLSFLLCLTCVLLVLILGALLFIGFRMR